LQSAADAELAIDIMQEHLDGALGDVEFMRDLFIAQSFNHEAGNFDFAWSECSHGRM